MTISITPNFSPKRGKYPPRFYTWERIAVFYHTETPTALGALAGRVVFNNCGIKGGKYAPNRTINHRYSISTPYNSFSHLPAK